RSATTVPRCVPAWQPSMPRTASIRTTRRIVLHAITGVGPTGPPNVKARRTDALAPQPCCANTAPGIPHGGPTRRNQAQQSWQGIRKRAFLMKMIPVTLLALCGASAVAYADGTLAGRVLDLNDQPVGGAIVTVKGADGAETRTVTDPTGRYVVTVHSAGPHAVTFSFGKVQNGAQVDIPADGKAVLDGKL